MIGRFAQQFKDDCLDLFGYIRVEPEKWQSGGWLFDVAADDVIGIFADKRDLARQCLIHHAPETI